MKTIPSTAALEVDGVTGDIVNNEDDDDCVVNGAGYACVSRSIPSGLLVEDADDEDDDDNDDDGTDDEEDEEEDDVVEVAEWAEEGIGDEKETGGVEEGAGVGVVCVCVEGVGEGVAGCVGGRDDGGGDVTATEADVVVGRARR